MSDFLRRKTVLIAKDRHETRQVSPSSVMAGDWNSWCCIQTAAVIADQNTSKRGNIVARFQLGDRVCISGLILTRHRNHTGTIVGISPSRHSRPGVTSLDKYTVKFDDGDQSEFYEIQIAGRTMERLPGNAAQASIQD